MSCMEDKEKQFPTQKNPQNNLPSQPNNPQAQEPIIAEVPEESQAIPQKSIVIFPTVVLLIIVSTFTGYLLYQNIQLKKALKISSFDDCAQEKGIIQESYPRVCITKDGRRFTEGIKETITTPIPENSINPEEKDEDTNLPDTREGNQL